MKAELRLVGPLLLLAGCTSQKTDYSASVDTTLPANAPPIATTVAMEQPESADAVAAQLDSAGENLEDMADNTTNDAAAAALDQAADNMHAAVEAMVNN